jgi:hypothetical protein
LVSSCFWPMHCLFFVDVRLLTTHLVSSNFYEPLRCLFFFDVWILITPLVSFGHCVVCSSSMYDF